MIVDEETDTEDLLDENISAQNDLSDTDSVSTVYSRSEESGEDEEIDGYDEEELDYKKKIVYNKKIE